MGKVSLWSNKDNLITYTNANQDDTEFKNQQQPHKQPNQWVAHTLDTKCQLPSDEKLQKYTVKIFTKQQQK